MAVKVFGRKSVLNKKLGFKVGHVADVIGKRALGAIDIAAPVLSAALPQYAPAIMAGQAAAHSADKSIRSGVSVANPRKGESRVGNVIQFGKDVESAQRDQERLKKQTALLRQ
jgi:hypothetical protein